MSKVSNWINPSAVIKLFTNTARVKTKDENELMNLVKQRPFRKIAEAWIAAIYLLSLNKTHSEVKYFMQDSRENAPDFYGLELFIENEQLKGHRKGIEVFRFVPDTDMSFLEEVGKKVKKSYSKDTVLVCQINRPGFAKTIGDMNSEIKNLNPKNEVWVVGGSGNMGEQIVAKIFPDISRSYINIEETIKTPYPSDYPAFIRAEELKFSKEKTESLKFEKTGKASILTPEFDLIED